VISQVFIILALEARNESAKQTYTQLRPGNVAFLNWVAC